MSAWQEKIDKKRNCPLCNLDLSKEKVFYEDSFFVVLRTKNLKGHKERMMIVAKPHIRRIKEFHVDVAIFRLEEIGRKLFRYVPKWVIMDSTFATIQEHWHLVATDLDPKSEDFEQIMETRWLKVVDNRNL